MTTAIETHRDAAGEAECGDQLEHGGSGAQVKAEPLVLGCGYPDL